MVSKMTRKKQRIPRIAILASGGGSTAEAFIHATQDGRVAAEVVLIVCSNPPEKAGVFERVRKLNALYHLNIQITMINAATHPGGKAERGQTDEESAAICTMIDASDITHVALMGYMRIVRGELAERYGWQPHFSSIYQARMSNTHPGSLPETEDTYGIHTQEKVLAMGLPSSKHTFHLVAAGIDRGPIIAEHPVEVMPNDTPQDLFDRVQLVEKTYLPGAINKFLIDQERYVHSNS